MKPCPVCDTEKKLKIKDCGYNTFNVGSVECTNCGFKLEYRNMNEESDYVKNWDLDMDIIKKMTNLNEKKKTILLLATFAEPKCKDKIKEFLNEME